MEVLFTLLNRDTNRQSEVFHVVTAIKYTRDDGTAGKVILDPMHSYHPIDMEDWEVGLRYDDIPI